MVGIFFGGSYPTDFFMCIFVSILFCTVLGVLSTEIVR